MRRDDFDNAILPYLRMYSDCCMTKCSVEAWWDSLKQYDLSLIFDALKRYVNAAKETPTPVSILALLPHGDPHLKYIPRFEVVNGEKSQVIQCRRCNDTGLVVWYDDEGRYIGRPCDCPAGHANYSWGWLPLEEQEEYIRTHGSHGEVVGEDWYLLWEKDITKVSNK